MWVVLSNLLRAWIEKVEEGWINSIWPFELGHWSPPALGTPSSEAFGPGLRSVPSSSPALGTLTALLAFLGVQLADDRLWDFLASITMWANTYNKFLFLLPSLPIFFPSSYSICLENPDQYMTQWPNSFPFILFYPRNYFRSVRVIPNNWVCSRQM